MGPCISGDTTGSWFQNRRFRRIKVRGGGGGGATVERRLGRSNVRHLKAKTRTEAADNKRAALVHDAERVEPHASPKKKNKKYFRTCICFVFPFLCPTFGGRGKKEEPHASPNKKLFVVLLFLLGFFS